MALSSLCLGGRLSGNGRRLKGSGGEMVDGGGRHVTDGLPVTVQIQAGVGVGKNLPVTNPIDLQSDDLAIRVFRIFSCLHRDGGRDVAVACYSPRECVLELLCRQISGIVDLGESLPCHGSLPSP